MGTEPEVQLHLPLSGHRSGGNDQYGQVGFFGPQGLDHQSGLDGLPQSDFVRQDEPDDAIPQHPAGRIELMPHGLDPGTQKSGDASRVLYPSGFEQVHPPTAKDAFGSMPMECFEDIKRCV
jgi:hypothetical protein